MPATYIPRKEIGWAEIGEQFTRYQLLKTKWLNVYLHRLNAPKAHAECHNHPWSFITLILWGGYKEFLGDRWHRRRPGTILYRRAETAHNVVTNGTSWSLVVTGPNRRDWGFQDCRLPAGQGQIPWDVYRARHREAAQIHLTTRAQPLPGQPG
ncbi:Uncharacterised protein [uncultured archaeon]|nr:Uncharacterised protein [uncultured archaeon]